MTELVFSFVRWLGLPYAGEGLKSHVVSLHRFNMMLASEASVPVHHKGDMLGHRSLSKSTDEQLAQLPDGPGDRRRICEPSRDSMLVQGSHSGRVLSREQGRIFGYF